MPGRFIASLALWAFICARTRPSVLLRWSYGGQGAWPCHPWGWRIHCVSCYPVACAPGFCLAWFCRSELCAGRATLCCLL